MQARWAAALPAVMAWVLLFMDQSITVRLVNSPRHKLKKGAGYHLVGLSAWWMMMMMTMMMMMM
jgi:hypothetical protein